MKIHSYNVAYRESEVTPMNVTALRLRMLRKERKMSQQQVADALGITRTAYNKYESGVITPSHKLRELMELFSVSADYLLGQDEAGQAAVRESSHIESQCRKYIDLSDSGRHIVDITLDAVYQREQKQPPSS